MERNTAEIIVKVYAVLAWLGALFSLIAAFAVFGMGALGGLGAMGDPNAAAAGGLLAGLGVVLGVFLLAYAVFAVAVGYGLWTYKPWARIATIVLSVLQLVSFPIGTVIGAVGIWLFGFEETVKSLFGAPAVKKRK